MLVLSKGTQRPVVSTQVSGQREHKASLNSESTVKMHFLGPEPATNSTGGRALCLQLTQGQFRASHRIPRALPGMIPKHRARGKP